MKHEHEGSLSSVFSYILYNFRQCLAHGNCATMCRSLHRLEAYESDRLCLLIFLLHLQGLAAAKTCSDGAHKAVRLGNPLVAMSRLDKDEFAGIFDGNVSTQESYQIVPKQCARSSSRWICLQKQKNCTSCISSKAEGSKVLQRCFRRSCSPGLRLIGFQEARIEKPRRLSTSRRYRPSSPHALIGGTQIQTIRGILCLAKVFHIHVLYLARCISARPTDGLKLPCCVARSSPQWGWMQELDGDPGAVSQWYRDKKVNLKDVANNFVQLGISFFVYTNVDNC